LQEAVVAGSITRPAQQVWDETSPEAIDLVQQLLNIDGKNRLSISEALNHKWLQE